MKESENHITHLFFPKFDEATEAHFLDDYNRKSIIFLQITLLATAFTTTVLFSSLDVRMIPIHKDIVWRIRFFIQLPTLLIAFYLTFKPIAIKRFQTLAFLSNFFLSLTVIAMIAISSPQELAHTQYYYGILLIMTLVIVMRIRFKATIINLTLVSAIYIFISVFYNEMLSTAVKYNHPILFINSVMFLFATYLSIAGASYLLENFSRWNFLAQQMLVKEKQIVEETIEEINTKNEEIKMKNTVLHQQNIEIEHNHQRITDSIIYAKHIQKKILPQSEKINNSIPKNFVLYKPKDIVSGDFYWFAHQNDITYIAAIDCTGHGVPGAFLTFICNNLLNKGLFEKNITSPCKLLNFLNDEINLILHSNEKEIGINDGMDLVLCAFDFNNNVLRFSGAKNPLILIREGEINRYKTNKQSIGTLFSDKPIHFEAQEIKLQKNDCIYIFSDGFADQFGEASKRKYMITRFRKKLLEIHKLSPEEQKKHLDNELSQWKGKETQTDDVLVIGIKI